MGRIIATVHTNASPPYISPDPIRVPPGINTIVWKFDVPGPTFAAEDYFRWKTEPPPPVGLPSRTDDGTQLLLTYQNSASTVVLWSYGVEYVLPDGSTVSIDPVIQNDPPTPVA